MADLSIPSERAIKELLSTCFNFENEHSKLKLQTPKVSFQNSLIFEFIASCISV